jgi:hypothetical protein
LGPDETKNGSTTVTIDGKENVLNRIRRRSVQVCDVHRRLKNIDIQEFKAMMLGPELYKSSSMVRSPSTNMRTSASHSNNGTVGWNSSAGDLAGSTTTSINVNAADAGTTSSTQQQQQLPVDNDGVSPMLEQRQQHLDKLYEAAVVADRNVKLSIFCTRPAIYSPLFNFICEFLCTTALIYGALMIYARRDLLYGPERSLYRSEEGIWIAFFVFLCILGLGGPTGIAANPARDFSPRVAHFLLPIPGKGKSEFYYSWIPFFAPFVGGCAAAGLYHATQLLNNSTVPSDQVFPVPQ